jgi:pimeloyl-ACP methyl ester carboxylesterase
VPTPTRATGPRPDRHPSDVTTATIDVGGGVTVTYDELGQGEPLFLLHGAESGRAQYADLMPRLGDGLRIVSYDQRDTGGTVNPPDGYTMSDLADDLARLVRALGFDRAYVLGGSFGGAVAMHFGLRHPDLAAGLVLVATTASADTARAFRARTDPMTATERSRFMLDAALSPGARDADPSLVDRVRDVLVERDPEAHARRSAALSSHDLEDSLTGLSVPTLLVHGSDDPIVPVEGAELMARRIPGARLEVLPGGRHAIGFEFADHVARLTREFVLG